MADDSAGADQGRRPQGNQWGELVLLDEIGQGSVATVYQAYDPRLNRAVAAKLLRLSSADPRRSSALLRGARDLSLVRHPNVAAVYGAEEHDGRCGLWMELVHGLTLHQMLGAHGPFSAAEAGLIGQDLCTALAAVHRAGLVHGDVKAQNVMRENGGRLILMDFGASHARSLLGQTDASRPGAATHVAPEVLAGGEDTIQSDIYSVGMLLHHLVSHNFPTTADTSGGLRQVPARLRELRPGLPEPFLRVVERATEREPARRFPSVEDMARALGGSRGAVIPESSRTVPAAVPGNPSGAEQAVRLAAGDRLGHYEILEQVGAGATGVVYRANDTRLRRDVAIKVLLQGFGAEPERMALFTQEAQVIAALSHPNILTLHDVGTERGMWYAVTELIHGQTLRTRMVRGPLPLDEAVEYAVEVAHGLAAAHSKRIIHMDLKPENLMITDDGWLKILDFGVARAGHPSPPPPDATTRTHRPERVWGTLAYMSPEQVGGDPIDHRSDLFSLGTILYEMLAGRHPFQRDSASATMAAILSDEPPPISTINPAVPPALDRIVRRSLRKAPDERFQSAREIRFALEAARDGVGRFDTPGVSSGTRRDLPSIAVLPFSDMSPAKDQECFCEGVAEELINALTQIAGLRVAARTSAFQFRGQARDVRQVGGALNVATILDGSVRKHDNRFRITVRLVNAADGYQLWSERFDRSMEDLFAVQDEIAAAVVKTLKGQLTTALPLVAPHTRDLDAYMAYLEGRYHWNKRTEEELDKSVQCFNTAIRRDPGYAVAFAGMADAYVTLGTHGARRPAEVMPSAKGALENALALDSGLAEAYACRGCVRSVFDWSWVESERDFVRSIQLNPSYPTAHHWYAINHLVPRARFEQAGGELQRALALDPLALAIRTSLGMTSYFAGRYDQARNELLQTIQLDDGFGMARAFLGATYTEMGRHAEALTELEIAVSLSGRIPETLASLGYLHGRAGAPDQARAVLDELTLMAGQRYVSAARLAQVHVGLGNRDEALDRLEEAVDEHAADVAWLAVRPVFADLRSEPRFRELTVRMGLGVAAPQV